MITAGMLAGKVRLWREGNILFSESESGIRFAFIVSETPELVGCEGWARSSGDGHQIWCHFISEEDAKPWG